MDPALFEAVRENCSRVTWSKGVELARRDAVTGDSAGREEINLRVLSRDQGVGYKVVLWPLEEETTIMTNQRLLINCCEKLFIRFCVARIRYFKQSIIFINVGRSSIFSPHPVNNTLDLAAFRFLRYRKSHW